MVSKDHKSLVEVTNLSVGFRTKDLVISAVENISFSIQKSEILALVGESGSGKSVTALSLLRLNELSNGYISSGKIFLKGEDITNLQPYEIKRKGLSRSFQITNIFPKMTVFENSATANLKIDRTKFNITYKSATLTNIVKDKAIYDEFDLSVKLSF